MYLGITCMRLGLGIYHQICFDELKDKRGMFACNISSFIYAIWLRIAMFKMGVIFSFQPVQLAASEICGEISYQKFSI